VATFSVRPLGETRSARTADRAARIAEVCLAGPAPVLMNSACRTRSRRSKLRKGSECVAGWPLLLEADGDVVYMVVCRRNVALGWPC